MVEIFLQTLPFFLLIGVGFAAAATGFFSEEATAALTKFVFYFALSAMLFRFSANLKFEEVFDPQFMLVYLWATAFVYLVTTAAAQLRGIPVAEAAIEAQCGVIGNIGFLGIPMLALIMGEAAVGYIMMMLAVDLLVFGVLAVALITGSKRAEDGPGMVATVLKGILTNPMLIAIFLGFSWSALELPIPGPINAFVFYLGAAATPGALFAIGASLASKSAERMAVAGWLSFVKLILHPAAIALAALVIWPIQPYAAAVMIASSALPTAGNIYMVAAHYGVAPQRVSATILISTICSIVTVSLVLAWLAERVAFQ
ncbi:malonate transporter [Candidatus Rhodobacter oscarellae]|uniref:Malonate transporter n=1 Tax=Candidatus Rhodobacter oscarellae TaxID=1675527 RepID=A0A0J9E888_9RHOB|nr:AEC family transporter [Candidatus Rhodobacter lobularis]KMW58955.1 malonate transporter [Candidatus Rhodobacter lobularis]